MGIGEIKKAFTGFVRDASAKTAEVGKALAREPVLAAKLQDVNLKLMSLKGWGPEVKVQRQALEAEKKQLMGEIAKNSALLPNKMDVIRNIR